MNEILASYFCGELLCLIDLLTPLPQGFISTDPQFDFTVTFEAGVSWMF